MMEQKHHKAYTDALNKALEIFVSYTENTFDGVMSNGLRPIADVADLDRIIVYRVWEKERYYAGEVYRWDKAGGGTVPIDESLKVLPVFGAMKRWTSMMSNDNCVSLRRSEFEDDEAAFLSPRGVMSIFIVPVFIDSVLWGAVTFQDNMNERDFCEDCVAMLRSVARLCASAIIREEKNQAALRTLEELKRHEKMTRTLNDTAILLLSQREETFKDTMTNGIGAVVNMLGLDRVTVWRNTMKSEGLYGGQIFRWDKSDGGTTPAKSQLKNIKVSEWTPRWEKVLSAGEVINGPSRLFPEAALLQSFGCVSIFIFPIFKDSDFWGYVMFEDRSQERVFTDDEAVILRSTSLMIYNAVIRHEESVQIKQMMSEIEYQASLLHTVNQISAILLESHTENFDSSMLRSMKIIAEAVRTDRMYIWKNFVRDGKLYCSQIYEWSEGVASQKDYKLAAETLYSDVVPGWEDRLSKGDCISGIVREMSDYEKAALSPQGILSILIVPIFIKEQFWGFVGFDDCHNERIFSDKEEMILFSASQIIAIALSRNDMERETAEKNELVRIIVDVSPVGLTMFDNNARLFDCNNAIASMFDVPKQCFLDRFSEFSPEYQPDGRKSIEKAIEIMRYIFDKKTVMTYEWVHKKLDGELVPCEITLTHAIHNGKRIGLVYVYDLRNVRNLENNIKQLEKEVDKIYYDPLTGIYNRRYFDENLNRLIKLLSRSKGTISLLMVDIDFFKDYNDTYGHSAGDKCLKIIAETLKNTILRINDFVARYGGEEFIVVLPNTDEKGAQLLAKNMLRNVRSCNISHSNSDVAERVTISIGVATGMAECANDGEDLVKSADEMLYKSKRNGRNRYSFRSI